MSDPVRIAIAGTGRMGASVAAAIGRRDDCELVGRWARGDDLARLVQDADVVIDFTLPGATAAIAAACASAGKPLVCGVTGLDAAGQEALARAADSIAVVYDRNMSIGIAVLANIIPEVSAALGPGFRIAIHETHHVHKKDAPSGTALKLGEALARDASNPAIDYKSERRGEVPGDHEVRFESPTETLSLGHSVVTRDVFAEGALRAALWAKDRPAGIFSMHDVLSAD